MTANKTSIEDPMASIFSSSSAVHHATVNDSSLTPAPFTGAPTDNCRDWLEYFKRFVHFKQLPEQAALDLFALLMRSSRRWTKILEVTRKPSSTLLKPDTCQHPSAAGNVRQSSGSETNVPTSRSKNTSLT